MATLLVSVGENLDSVISAEPPLANLAPAKGWELREDSGMDGPVRYGVYLNGSPKVLGLGQRVVAARVLRRLASGTV